MDPAGDLRRLAKHHNVKIVGTIPVCNVCGIGSSNEYVPHLYHEVWNPKCKRYHRHATKINDALTRLLPTVTYWSKPRNGMCYVYADCNGGCVTLSLEDLKKITSDQLYDLLKSGL